MNNVKKQIELQKKIHDAEMTKLDFELSVLKHQFCKMDSETEYKNSCSDCAKNNLHMNQEVMCSKGNNEISKVNNYLE